jgi:hypothetical protein
MAVGNDGWPKVDKGQMEVEETRKTFMSIGTEPQVAIKSIDKVYPKESIQINRVQMRGRLSLP